MLSPQEFQNLQTKWYLKLEEEGFKDIEKNGQLRTFNSQNFPTNYTPEEFNEKQTYYQKSQELYNDDIFLSKTEKMIWKLHSEGVPIRSIANYLRAEGQPVETTWLVDLLKELRSLMLET